MIIPPAKDVKTANERLAKIEKGEMQGYDWWFAHKDSKPAPAKKATPVANKTKKK